MIPEKKEQLKVLVEKTRTNFIKITPVISDDISITSSKIGGVPYWKQSMPYPQVEGKTAKLMAQINFDDLTKNGLSLPDFPESGILQFYFAQGDDMWGLTFDGSPSQIKVVYHKDTTEQSYVTKQMTKIAENNHSTPYDSPCI